MVNIMVCVVIVENTQNSLNKKGKQMDEIDYTKVTANEVRLNCKECKGNSTLHALVFINEDGEVTAYHHDGCYVCESN